MAVEWQSTPGSSNIKAIGYDAETGRLHVEFDGGNQYSYAGVTPEVHQAFLAAPSAGKFFYGHIRGKYSHQQA